MKISRAEASPCNISLTSVAPIVITVPVGVALADGRSVPRADALPAALRDGLALGASVVDRVPVAADDAVPSHSVRVRVPVATGERLALRERPAESVADPVAQALPLARALLEALRVSAEGDALEDAHALEGE